MTWAWSAHPSSCPLVTLASWRVKDSARSGPLARTRGLFGPNVMKVGESSTGGGRDKDDMEGKSAVTKRDDMGMVGATVKSPSRGSRQLEVKDSARLGLLAKASEALEQSPERAGEAGIEEETAIVEETVMSDAGEMENAGADLQPREPENELRE
eukprot:4288547-Pleurochrysis_carterae.AAC.1